MPIHKTSPLRSKFHFWHFTYLRIILDVFLSIITNIWFSFEYCKLSRNQISFMICSMDKVFIIVVVVTPHCIFWYTFLKFTPWYPNTNCSDWPEMLVEREWKNHHTAIHNSHLPLIFKRLLNFLKLSLIFINRKAFRINCRFQIILNPSIEMIYIRKDRISIHITGLSKFK